MYFYYFMMRRYTHSWQQARCFALYIPSFICLYLLATLLQAGLPVIFHLLLALLGWITATFIEYIVHRFWMHNSKGRESASTFVSYHNHHHTHPSEIIITTTFRIILVLGGMLLTYISFRLQNSFTFLAGLYLGFCTYTLMHKAIHQPWAKKLFPKLTRFHIYHHCKFPNACFGITVTWWDEIFRTGPPKGAKISPRIIEFYFDKTSFKTNI
jgi:hypothetical protein